MSAPARKPSIAPAACDAEGLPAGLCPTCGGAHFASRGAGQPWFCTACSMPGRTREDAFPAVLDTCTVPGGPPADAERHAGVVYIRGVATAVPGDSHV